MYLSSFVISRDLIENNIGIGKAKHGYLYLI